MANVLEFNNNNRHRNQSEHRFRSTIILLCLLVAGYLGNYFHIPMILHIDWLFGSLFVMLVVRFYGLGWGAIAALIANSYTILLWKHPYAFIIFTLEALFVGWRLGRHSKNLLLIDVMYWGLIGFPLLWFLYAGVGKTEARLSPSSLGRSGIAREPTGEQINLCYDFEYTPQECE